MDFLCTDSAWQSVCLDVAVNLMADAKHASAQICVS